MSESNEEIEDQEQGEVQQVSKRTELIKKLKMTDFLGIAYAVIVASGGAIGYVKSGSIPSVASGLVFGSLIAFGSYQVSRGNGCLVSLGASSLLGGLMGYRFISSGKFMPAGLIGVISIGMAVRYAFMAINAKQSKA